MLQVLPKAKGCKSKVVCDALMLDESSQSDTYPTMEVGNSSADLEHEAKCFQGKRFTIVLPDE